MDTSRLTETGKNAMVGVYEQNGDDFTTYSTYKHGKEEGKITNLFDGCTADGAKYLSRSDWSVMDGDGLRYGYASAADSGAEIPLRRSLRLSWIPNLL